VTDLLRGDGWTAIIIAVVAFVGIWLGPIRPAGRGWSRMTGPER
jgi:hypothetical protein